MSFDPAAFVAGSRWTYARTMPQIPHEYTVRGRTAHRDFEAMVQHIRAWGYDRRWRADRDPLTYLELDGWRYWTMGSPIEETTIINRERLPAEPLFEREEGQ